MAAVGVRNAKARHAETNAPHLVTCVEASRTRHAAIHESYVITLTPLFRWTIRHTEYRTNMHANAFKIFNETKAFYHHWPPILFL